MASAPSPAASTAAPPAASASPGARDVIGGVTTFLTMAYIVAVNPQILATPGTGMPFTGVLTATVLLSASMTLLMGLYAKIPFAVAPGMGINAFFTFSIVLGHKVPWQTALGIVFWAGVAFLLVSVTPAREIIARAIPPSLKRASAAGIGAFLAFIGLKGAGLVVADPVTFVKLGHLGAEPLLAIFGMIVLLVLLSRRSAFAFLGAIVAVTLASVALRRTSLPAHWVSAPDFRSVLGRLDVGGALAPSLLPAMIAILFTDLFDSISTFVGVATATGLVDEQGEPRGLRRGLLVDALATFGAALLGTSSGTAFIESAAGIEAGARTGRASVVTALCFLPFLFLAPLIAVVPACATAPVLIVVGALMFRSVAGLDLAKLEDAVPVFLTVALIPLTFSITQGILWGLLAHVGLYVVAGRRREIAPAMWPIAGACLLLLWLEHRG
jgi:AGZA family xanthine/uracil permease-like MFS transporter